MACVLNSSSNHVEIGTCIQAIMRCAAARAEILGEGACGQYYIMNLQVHQDCLGQVEAAIKTMPVSQSMPNSDCASHAFGISSIAFDCTSFLAP